MIKNTGKKSEDIFDEYCKKQGKLCFLQEFMDAASFYGRNRARLGRVPLNVPPQPSDRLVVLDGETFFAEVKSSTNKTSFPFGNIKKTQLGFARRIIAAGGTYYFFLHNLNTDLWYRLPAQTVLFTIESGKKSVKWSALGEDLAMQSLQSRRKRS